MSEPLFRLPGNSHRTVITGRTGSGKTQFGYWLLTKADFDSQPWVIVDYKGDDLLNASGRVEEIGFKDIPKYPGLYKISPLMAEDEAMDEWLIKCWYREKIGFYMDEGYRLPRTGQGFNAILTQGRSKRLPAIILTQRPSWISKFVFSEADFFAIMHLNEKNDRKRVLEFTGDKINIDERLEDYWAHWYDVGKDTAFKLKPVPKAEDLVEILHSRLKPKRRIL